MRISDWSSDVCSSDLWWKRYSLFIYAAAAMVVIRVAGYQGWRAYDLKLRGERSDSYAEALRLAEAGDTGGARAVLAALRSPSDGGYSMLAALIASTIAAEASATEAAQQTWPALAEDGTG